MTAWKKYLLITPLPKSLKDEDLAFASLYSGIARVVQIDLRTEGEQTLDTHIRHADTHLAAQGTRWERIAKFLSNLRQHDLLKQTLVMVVSEFNRTPGLNANGGKDHNYSDNAVALFGRGVNGGTVIGGRNLFKRSDGFPYAFWAGSFIDFDSGEVVPISKELWQSGLFCMITVSLPTRLRNSRKRVWDSLRMNSKRSNASSGRTLPAQTRNESRSSWENDLIQKISTID
jgi:hypothetical protein